jgi:hypothetical protein
VARKKRLVRQRQAVIRLGGNLVGLEPIHPARVADYGIPPGELRGYFRRRISQDAEHSASREYIMLGRGCP